MENQTIRLLFLDESPNEAEALITLIRNAGHATRAHRIMSEEDMVEALREQTWDLVLARSRAGDYTATKAIEQIKRQDKDIPFLLLADDDSTEHLTKGLKMGATDVILPDQDERLIIIVERELNNLNARRERKKTQIELHDTEKRCDLLLASSKDAITYVHDGMHIYANSAYVKRFGYQDSDELEGTPLMDLIASEDQDKFKEFMRRYNRDKTGANEFISKLVGSHGEFQGRMTFSAAHYDGEPCTQIVIRSSVDNTELEQKLKEISSQDLLTGLHNRNNFLEQLDEAVEEASNGGQHSSLYYLMLDDFAKIKTEVGISGADLVLGDIASVLKQAMNNIEHTSLARFGDDVFTMVAKESDPDKVLAVGKSVCKAVEECLSDVSGRTVQMTCSIGIALINDNTPSSQEILSRAHKAATMVEVDNKPGNGVHLHTIDDEQNSGRGSDSSQWMIRQLQDAIDNNRFILLYQPIISLHGYDDEHYEVLLRMPDDEDNEVGPQDFLKAADQAQLCEKLDRWVILQSIKILASHRAKGSNTRLFINLTHNSLKDKTLLQWISMALKAARLPSDALIFQFNELDAITYLKHAKEFTKGLSELHCKASISRFGCSLNPFNTLKHITVDYVKLDGSFTHDLHKSEKNLDEMKSTLNNIQSQGKMSIVPMVESASTLSMLWQAGVNYVQGFYIQPPGKAMDYDFSSTE